METAGNDNGGIQMRVAAGETFAMPSATAFRMSGDYASNVAVTFGPDGELAYYPAPTDITAQSAPVAIGEGWWLNRQGLSANSVFTKWTFEEYAALNTVPSRQEIMEAVIPGARVTEMISLPISLSEALQNPQNCIKYCH